MARAGLGLVTVLLLSAGCAGPGRPVAPPERSVWPSPPAAPRVWFAGEVRGPADLGVDRGFWAFLGDWVTGRPEPRLVHPMAVVATPGGVLWVADPGVAGVHSFDRVAGRYRLVRGPGGSPLPSPVALALAPDGTVFVADSALARVLVIEPGAREARTLGEAGALVRPAGLAVAPDGQRVYVVDAGAHQVVVWNRQGRAIGAFGRRGSGLGELNFPTAAWADAAGRVHVADTLNFRLQTFDADGTPLEILGQLGDGAGDHARPKGLAVDSSGRRYVVDGLFHVLQVFDADGTILLSLGGLGREPGQFWLPAGVFLSAKGLLYVADTYNGRVQRFRLAAEE